MPSRGRRQAAPRAPVVALAALALVSAGSCAHHIGKKASQGAIQAFKQNEPQDQPMRIAAGRAVGGAIDALEDPEQQRRIGAIIEGAVDAAVARSLAALDDPRQQERMRELVDNVVDEAMGRALQGAVGTEGGQTGPAFVLVDQISQVAARAVMREAVQGVGTGLDQIFPPCAPGLDASACRHQRMRALTSEAGASFAVGVLDVVSWPLLAATGLLGLLFGLFAHWLWTLRRRPRSGGGAPVATAAPRGPLRPIAESRAP